MLKVMQAVSKTAFWNANLAAFSFRNLCNFVFSWLLSLPYFFPHISQNKGQLIFEDKWPVMEPVVLKLLLQDHVDNSWVGLLSVTCASFTNWLCFAFSEWQDLFYTVHSVCLWDEKGAQKIRDSLEDLIVKFIKQAQSRVLIAGEEQALLKAYIIEWRKFFTQSSFLPLPFWQLETTLQVSQRSISLI